MAQIRVPIPFDSLLPALDELDLEEKRRLLERLEDQVAHAEEELWEQDPEFREEIRQARESFQAGDYLTIDEYAARRAKAKE